MKRKEVDQHTTQCFICYNMEARGYDDEREYWDDYLSSSANKLKSYQFDLYYFWNKLSEGGNPQAQQCGWLMDKYGFSWQVIPNQLPELLTNPDKAKADRVLQAMLKMKKIDIATLEKAAG